MINETSKLNRAIVLSAGLGTRMMPLTAKRPKPLVEVNGKALLDYVLDELIAGGVGDAIVNLHYFPEQIEAHLKARTNITIDYSDERTLLMETGGAIVQAKEKIGDAPFFSTNTDAFFAGGPVGAATRQLREGWRSDMEALLLLVPLERSCGFDGNGDFHLYTDGSLEKAGDEETPFAFTGLQILHPRLIENAPEGPFSSRVFWKKAAERGTLYGLVYPHHWLHVGTPKGIELAEEKLHSLKE